MVDDSSEPALRGRDLIGLGGLLVGAVVAGVLLGLLVDNLAGTAPAFELTGLALGVLLGIAGFVVRVRAALRRRPARGGGPLTAVLTQGETVRHPWLRVISDQRKTCWVALAFMIAGPWILGPLGYWTMAGCVAGGVLLGLLNHLAMERWLLGTITSGHPPSRNQMIRATLVRLGVVAVVAVAAAYLLWPDGIGLLLGLAIFRLVALMMTSVTLLRELKDDV